jgi:multidrug efflux pump subunit AcrA (membrane-fusion protein)
VAEPFDRSARRQRLRRRRRRLILSVVVAALVLGGGGTAWALTRSTGPALRTATVTRGSVAQTVDVAGTIQSVNQATLSFPVAGKVKKVAVGVGDTVTAGQALATLDTTSLDQAVQTQQTNLAQAEQTLAADQQSQLTATSTTTSAFVLPATSTTPGTTTDAFASAPASTTATLLAAEMPLAAAPVSPQLVAAVKAAQQKVVNDQKAVDIDGDIAKADEAIVAENTACQSILSGGGTNSTAGGSTSASASSGSSSAQDLQSCQDAITAVQAAQKTVQSDEDGLAADEKSLDAAVSALLAGLSSSGSGSPGGSSGGSTGGSRSGSGTTGHPSSRTSGSGSTASASNTPSGTGRTGTSNRSAGSGGSGGSGSAGGRVITAAQLAADQSEIDAARAELTLAQQNARLATLTSPIAGTVASVSISVGSAVSASSSSASIRVVGSGQKRVTTTVGIADVDRVKPGQSVRIVVDGVSTPLQGKVTFVGVLNTSGTSGTTTTYPVTILLDPTSLALYDGAGASVSIDVGKVSDVLTVPVSALHPIGSAYTVTIDTNGTLTTTRVQIGAVGADSVQLTSGVREGDRVVLADIKQAVPSSNTISGRTLRGVGITGTTTGTFGGGGLGGGGLGGGGLGGK